jgi:hypothetical protein
MARRPDPALPQWWRELISLQTDSGMNIAQFCHSQQISTAAFYRWRRKLKDIKPPPEDRFLSVQVVGENTTDAPFRVHLAGGAVVEIPSPHRDVLLGLVEKLHRVDEPVQSEDSRS